MAEGADQGIGIDWGLVGAVIGFAAISISLLLYQHRQLLDQLEDPADRARIRDRLTTDVGVARRFRDGIDGLITRIDGYFGPSLGWRAFDRCLLHAFLYPILLFLAAWLAGASGGLGAIEMLGATVWWQQCLTVVGIGSAFALAQCMARSKRLIRREIIRLLQPRFQSKSTWANEERARHAGMQLSEGLVITVVGVFGLAIAFALNATGTASRGAASAFAGIGPLAVAVVTVFAGVLGSPVSGAFAVVFVATFAIIVVIVGTGAGAGADAATAICVFYVALPVANAALDWASWAVTRALLRRSSDGAGATWAAIGMALRLATDLCLAFVSLCGLAVLLPNAIEATNWLLALLALPTVSWLPHLNQALEAPFTAGFFVTGMLLTTLVPTLLHFVAGLFGVFAVWTWGGRRMAALIPADPSAAMSTYDRQRVAWFMLQRRLWVLPSSLACLPLVAGLAWILTYFTGPIGLFLADLALCGTSWSHGLCPFWD